MAWSIMKWLKQNAVLLLISAGFALFLGLNIWNFVSGATPDASGATPCRDAVPLRAAHSLDDASASAATLDSRDGAHYLQVQSRGQRLLLRSLRMGSLDGFGGRGLVHPAVARSYEKLRLPPDASQTQYPSPVAFRYPKDYFVYTLERMLC